MNGSTAWQITGFDYPIECAGACAEAAPGHALHPMRRRLAALTPSRWSDAVVLAVHADGTIELAELHSGERFSLWQHEASELALEVGSPVAVHGGYGVLAIGRDWRSVVTRTPLRVGLAD